MRVSDLKTALIAVNRSDVFLAYNDGPSSGQMANGMCSGLDYFSTANCNINSTFFKWIFH